MNAGANVGANVMVSGAASGIGASIVRSAVEEGFRVVAVDLDGASLDRSVAQYGDQVLGRQVDVCDQADVDRALDAADEFLGPIQSYVNCAGIVGRTGVPSHEMSASDFEQVIRVNLHGAFIQSRAVIERMLPHGYGRVLHFASIAGKEGNANMSPYSASKAGVIGMVKSQGKEYVGSGITINAIAPAVIQTPMVDDMPVEQADALRSKIPMGRCGTLDEAWAAVRWAISPECSFTTGFCFDLSGGRAVY
jgi:2-dehydro-3-deoxy-L-rhamnonate dehydrogenase (NAD+)